MNWQRRGRGRGRLARHGRRGKRREEHFRISVTLRVGEQPDAELQVRDGMRGDAAGADDRDGLALGHDGAPRHEQRAQMQERDGVTVHRLDRDRQAVGSDPPREGHGPGGGRQHGAAERPLDVDPTVLTGGEWIFLVEVEHL